LPGATHIKGIQEEAERISKTFLNDKEIMKLYNKPCLIINKSQEYNLNDNDEVKKFKEFIPEIDD